jgi:hypothetical protein
MEKFDFKKTLKPLYNAKETPAILEIPALKFLLIDGQGNPNTAPEYKDALQALYSVAYTLKFKVKKEMGLDYGVSALEGLWWMDDMLEFTVARKDDWKWTMMICQPDFIPPELATAAMNEASRKKDLPSLSGLRFDTYAEGLSAQLLHLGPYAAEAPNIQRLHEFISASGYALGGKHHEIYLTDPNRSAPDKMKTIIRQPVQKA